MRVRAAVLLVAPAVGLALLAHHTTRPCPNHPLAMIGDSNVLGWDLGPGCLNLGISGDTSQRMAARFDAVFTAGRAPLLVIWATQNDLRRDFGLRYYRDMVAKARRAGLKVILATPAPASTDPANTELSAQIQALGRSEGLPVANLRRALSMPWGGPNPLLYRREGPDGTVHQHLNRLGQIVAWWTLSRSL